jgi:hypothetical protein
MAEQRTLNPQVSGSNPEGRTIKVQFRRVIDRELGASVPPYLAHQP